MRYDDGSQPSGNKPVLRGTATISQPLASVLILRRDDQSIWSTFSQPSGIKPILSGTNSPDGRRSVRHQAINQS